MSSATSIRKVDGDVCMNNVNCSSRILATSRMQIKANKKNLGFLYFRRIAGKPYNRFVLRWMRNFIRITSVSIGFFFHVPKDLSYRYTCAFGNDQTWVQVAVINLQTSKFRIAKVWEVTYMCLQHASTSGDLSLFSHGVIGVSYRLIIVWFLSMYWKLLTLQNCSSN